MGICCSLYALSPEQLARLRADPPLIWRLVEPDDETPYLAEVAPPQRISWLQRLFGQTRAPAAPAVAVPDFPAHERMEVDLDKSWDGLRHCLGLCAPDAPDFFAGDGSIGRIEVGYGPALAVDSGTLARYAAALEGIDEEGLRRQLQSTDFKDVYLGDVWRRRGADAEDYLLENFRELLGFLRQAAAQGQAAVICYT
ncbi:DUF1877 family protein [Mitsuaria sp. WAJ17]|uniref:DUF1877 family protein n=1 Tax=Mitsuaria sp. WAJ17 TaxID=2761452 RepID=UPI00160368DC|nr:DUF1877 family protein [Mitsuaria sp. WAJ17]MBB2486187.1 DUF1877 family protein [Mitsuaria sp. WAJ17]